VAPTVPMLPTGPVVEKYLDDIGAPFEPAVMNCSMPYSAPFQGGPNACTDVIPHGSPMLLPPHPPQQARPLIRLPQVHITLIHLLFASIVAYLAYRHFIKRR
jgi:hypothetical protein